MTETLNIDQNETPLPGTVESDVFELEMTDFGSAYSFDNGPTVCRCICSSCLCACVFSAAEES